MPLRFTTSRLSSCFCQRGSFCRWLMATSASLQTPHLNGKGHGDTLAPLAHRITLGLALAEVVLAVPVLVPLAVPAVGVCTGTVVPPVALSLHPGVGLPAVTPLARVECLAPASAGVLWCTLSSTLLGFALV